MIRVSVCMATFNGENYLKEQLESILYQLANNDELIISDDSSTDDTISIVESFRDSRIKVFKNTLGKGPVKNFENSISKANGRVIFLADQDDIWNANKVQTILSAFESDPNLTCIFSNAAIINGEGKNVDKNFFAGKPNLSIINVLLKNQFLGCTMAFLNIKVNLLPFPQNLPMHDWYIGLQHLKKGKVRFIDQNLIFYRRHGKNVTTGIRSNLFNVLKWRFQIIKSLL